MKNKLILEKKTSYALQLKNLESIIKNISFEIATILLPALETKGNKKLLQQVIKLLNYAIRTSKQMIVTEDEIISSTNTKSNKDIIDKNIIDKNKKIIIKVRSKNKPEEEEELIQDQDDIKVIQKKKTKTDLERKTDLFDGWKEFSRLSRGIVENSSGKE